MEKILVPTDFTELALWAADAAFDIASKSGATIVLLHVVEAPGEQSFNVQGEIDHLDSWEDKLYTLKLIEKQSTRLHDLADSISAKGVNVKTVLRIGNAYHGISTIIAEQDVSLIVMGTHGRSALASFFVGSNTEKVILNSKKPVLTIHQKPETHEYKTIVYATTFDEREWEFSEIVKRTQELCHGTIHLVRINTPANFQSDQSIKDQMLKFVARFKLKNYTLNIINDHNEEDGILRFAENMKADLIGMATHEHTGFARALSGSISQGVVSHSHRPVLTYVTHTN